MKIIAPSFEILDELDGKAILKKLELIGRVCYKSENRITEDSASTFIKAIIDRGHGAILEHFSFSVKFTVDRGVSHELVRHRIASFAQESTRYCNYGKSGEITVISPIFKDSAEENFKIWKSSMESAEVGYMNMLHHGATPQEARSVLPNSLKTEIVVTANLREWRHILELRCSVAAHPQIRQIMLPLLLELQKKIPVMFDDIKY